MREPHIPITREGYPFIAFAGFVTLVFAVLEYDLIALAGLVLTALVVNFFRDPERTVTRDEQALISPADGTVIAVKNVTEDNYLHGPAQRISIFMSVFNVHVNRTPLTGTIDYIQYNPGKFINAFKEKASEDNENLLIGIHSQESGVKIAVRFIAGLIARRIVFYKKENDRVEQGERINIIRFGSRVDLFCPPGSEILVKNGQKVTAGVTVMARLTAK